VTQQPSAAVAAKADMACAALARTWQHLARALPDAWVVRDGGAVACVTGVGVPWLNGVWPEHADADPGAVAGLLDRVQATGLPHSLHLLRLPGVRCYLGEAGGQTVTTGVGVTLGDFTGVFNIATPPAHRRRGHGAAVTARAVADGLAAGAKWAWLQSSPPGYATYTRLGFETVETWKCWITSG